MLNFGILQKPELVLNDEPVGSWKAPDIIADPGQMIWHKEVLEFPSLLKATEQTFDEAVEACALDTWNGQHEVGNRRQLRNRAEEEELPGNSFKCSGK